MNYFNLKESIIDEATWQTILKYEKSAKYNTYVTEKGTVTQLQAALAYPSEESQQNASDPLNILLSKFNSKLVMNEEKILTFIKFNEGGGIFPHTDDARKRSTTFAWAVNLDSKYFLPILFHDPEDRSKIVDKGYYKPEGIVFNTQKVHSVEPSERKRVSFQISFSNPIEEVHELYMNGVLFND